MDSESLRGFNQNKSTNRNARSLLHADLVHRTVDGSLIKFAASIKYVWHVIRLSVDVHPRKAERRTHHADVTQKWT